MNRIHKALIILGVLAVPAAAHSTFTQQKQTFCFASGAATYQISPNAAAPDYRIRIGGEAGQADLRMQLVSRAEQADFVLVDDFSAEPTTCKSTTPIRTVTLDPANGSADVTIHLSADSDAADFKVYVHSIRYSQQDAAALLGAIWKADQRRQLAATTAR